MNETLFADEANVYAVESVNIILRLRQNTIFREHLLLALITKPSPELKALYSTLNIDIKALLRQLEFVASRRIPQVPAKDLHPDKLRIEPALKRALDQAELESRRFGENKINSELMLLALIQSYFAGQDADLTLQKILGEVKLEPQKVRKALLQRPFRSGEKESE